MLLYESSFNCSRSHLVLQFLLALLAGIGAFTVLHVLGFGLLYKVKPFRSTPGGTVSSVTNSQTTNAACSRRLVVVITYEEAIVLTLLCNMQASYAGLALVGGFFAYKLFKGESLDGAAGELKVCPMTGTTFYFRFGAAKASHHEPN